MAKKRNGKPQAQKGGRPQGRITLAQRTILISMFQERATKEAACREAKITTKLFDRTMERDGAFSSEMSTARNYANRIAKQSVIKGMSKDPTLALKFLERTDPEFKPKSAVQFTDEDRAEQLRKIEAAGLSVPEYGDEDDKTFLPLALKK